LIDCSSGSLEVCFVIGFGLIKFVAGLFICTVLLFTLLATVVVDFSGFSFEISVILFKFNWSNIDMLSVRSESFLNEDNDLDPLESVSSLYNEDDEDWFECFFYLKNLTKFNILFLKH
jgi:hypothetical protein